MSSARALSLAVAPLALGIAVISMTQGAMSVSWDALWSSLSSSALERHVLLSIRAPRVVMGALTGASLAASGAALQGVFRNPLADPGLIGVSSGAALAVVCWIVFGSLLGVPEGPWTPWLMALMAFGGGLLATLLVLRISSVRGRVDVATMLLAGVAIGVLVGALIGLATYLSDDQQLRSLTLWTMGSLAGASWAQVGVMSALILPGLFYLRRLARSLDVMALGAREAAHLGVPVERVRARVVLWVALMIGASVGFTGMIGFVGLVVPHLWRLAAGPGHRRLIPGAMWLGASLLMAADLAARQLAAPAELPIGVLTALMGGPFFLALLIQQRHQHSP